MGQALSLVLFELRTIHRLSCLTFPVAEVAMLARFACALAVAVLLVVAPVFVQQPEPTSGAIEFHHVHLNSVDPIAAVAWYAAAFPSTSKTTVAGFPALQTGTMYLLFTKVNTPPPTSPQTAIWHFGWHVVDSMKDLERHRASGRQLLPLYTSEAGEKVYISSAALPGMLTASQLKEAIAKGAQPTNAGGWAYLGGPDGVPVEYQGNMPAERFNHVHMFHGDPFCAQQWYQKHLGLTGREPTRADVARGTGAMANCQQPRGEPSWPSLVKTGTVRSPTAGVRIGDFALNWYPRQGDQRLAPSRGQAVDHMAFTVTDLDARLTRMRADGVKVIEAVHRFGDGRAVMIEGPDQVAIELIELRKSATAR